MDGTVPAANSGRKRFLPRCVLLTIALLSSVPCLLLAINVRRSWQQSAAVEAILMCPGCELYYERQGSVNDPEMDRAIHGSFPEAKITKNDYDCDLHGCPWRIPLTGLRGWTERVCGPNFVRRVVTAEIDSNHFCDIARWLPQLPSLKRVLLRTVNDDQQKEILAATGQLERELPGVEVLIEVHFDFDSAYDAPMTGLDITVASLRAIIPTPLLILSNLVRFQVADNILIVDLEIGSEGIGCGIPLPAFLTTAERLTSQHRTTSKHIIVAPFV